MKYYFAPMEGVTGYLYRSAHNKYFGGIDKYFTPFINPNKNSPIGKREKADVLPEHNPGMYVVPQVLTCQAEHFLAAAAFLSENFGYEEINLNLGCPSGTVTTKGKGSGFLAKTQELDRFLEDVFAGIGPKVKVSLKTRIGFSNSEEFEELLGIYEQYPLEEIIIHPRVREDFYNGSPNQDTFSYAMEHSEKTLCYNGDIFKRSDFEKLQKRFPKLACVMLGRGLISNPNLAVQIQTGNMMNRDTFWNFQNEVKESYQSILSGDRDVLFKMKELWFYMGYMFKGQEKYKKKIRKAQKLEEYDTFVKGLFEEGELLQDTSFTWAKK